ncbi:MAG: RNase adapter RapZ [Nitrospira sp.]|nr:RNase adapter RapZ [bacterium]MBL7049972.1 RNase adapter RapZ [Nitrospira sp.]
MKKTSTSSLSIIILTGLSGSGKSVALNAFEDIGYFCIDNLPTLLIDTFATLNQRTPGTSKIAIGIDIRERRLFDDFPKIISALRKKHNLKIIYLEARDSTLISRFKETRRPHPLGDKDLKKSLHKEAKLLSPIRKEADKIIDTSSLTVHELRKFIIETFGDSSAGEMKIRIMSFGYKYGIPLETDLLFDVRFLPNPYFIKELKPYSGKNPKVRDFVLGQKDTKLFLEKLNPLLDHIIPLYKREGKSYLTIGIGCTGGRHRSPAIAEKIKKSLKKQKHDISISHRDIGVA